MEIGQELRLLEGYPDRLSFDGNSRSVYDWFFINRGKIRAISYIYPLKYENIIIKSNYNKNNLKTK